MVGVASVCECVCVFVCGWSGGVEGIVLCAEEEEIVLRRRRERFAGEETKGGRVCSAKALAVPRSLASEGDGAQMRLLPQGQLKDDRLNTFCGQRMLRPIRSRDREGKSKRERRDWTASEKGSTVPSEENC